MNKNQRFVITIGRERGSGGRMVGKELARRFHIHYYDREILACASKELNVDEAYLASIDEAVDELYAERLPCRLWRKQHGF